MRQDTMHQASISRLLSKELGCNCYDNAYVLPSRDLWKEGKCFGGVVTQSGEFIESSAWHEGKRCDKYDFNPKDAVCDDSIVIYMGFYNPCWGHAITDNLKKIWYLHSPQCKELLQNGAKFIYLTIDNNSQPQYVKRLFQLAGADVDSFELVTDITKYKKIYIPDNSFVADKGQRYYSQIYVQTIKTIKTSVKIQHLYSCELPSKIYFSRTHLRNSRDFGEKSIEQVFRKKGYTVVYPEEHSVDEQIALLMNCKSFAASEGSISHNAVFCSPGTEVIILRKCFDVNKYQMALNEVADINVTYIDAHKSIKTPENAPWAGPFYMCVTSHLEHYIGHGIFRIPNCFLPSWYIYKYQLEDCRYYQGFIRMMRKILFSDLQHISSIY